MTALISALMTTASAQDVPIDIRPELVRYGWQPFGSFTKRRFTITNQGLEPLSISIGSGRVGDDFSPGQIESTCPMTGPTLLMPGESCFHAVGFMPSEFFGGHEVAALRVVARDPDDHDPVFAEVVRLVGVGYHDGDRVVDLSDNGPGPLDWRLFDEDGIWFLRGDTVVRLNGDDALVGPIAFATPDVPGGVIVSFSPTDPGTAEYVIVALDADGDVLASGSVFLTHDPGVPEPGVPGYVTIALDDIPGDTRTIALTNRFVESSDPDVDEIRFGVASVRLFVEGLP